MDINKLYSTGRVKRFHTTDLPAQTISSHSWGVAMIVAAIYPKPHPVPSHLLLAALTHDCAEALTGDTPSPTLREYPELDMVIKTIERKYNKEAGIEFDLTDRERAILKWADTFECVLFAEHASLTGIAAGHFIMLRAQAYLKDMGFPTSEAKELYESVFSNGK